MQFFEEWSWLNVNELGRALDMAFEFYKSVAKILKLKVRKFCSLIPTFREVIGKNGEGWMRGFDHTQLEQG